MWLELRWQRLKHAVVPAHRPAGGGWSYHSCVSWVCPQSAQLKQTSVCLHDVLWCFNYSRFMSYAKCSRDQKRRSSVVQLDRTSLTYRRGHDCRVFNELNTRLGLLVWNFMKWILKAINEMELNCK